MKKHYSIKTMLCIGIFAFMFQQTFSQIRIVEVDPVANTVKLHNFGSAMNPQDISSYWFCARFAYDQVGGLAVVSGSTNLAIGADVVLTLDSALNTTSSDVGFYNSSSFGSAAAMEDFMQYGGGGIGRENVAVNKGIWTAGTFVSEAPPYQYTGSGAQNGFQFWDTVLGLNDFNRTLDFNLYPNPVSSVLNIELHNNEVNLTFQVFDILGKQVIKGSSKTNNTLKIDITSLEHGLYIIKIVSGDKTETKRFIKN
ncbi:T9SS type A sorting domain-containing protein [Psychroserpens ponticola]|uniref:T9SS type A sorting domain-containing protein n=1 Tax=Psychroserpens ponticola TaxID=2932268 RepID=A0ABY7RU44_9FLAO|nr:T9SS type A sorting domain-containing protein [Psychroserpens ponticola]WCO00624.1 T9SS type A sorting domain-containing protein [Psychroserpens ponticola]